MPPMGEMIATAVKSRGPLSNPCSMAAAKPASSPPASRTAV
jgi:hypothetical protein